MNSTENREPRTEKKRILGFEDIIAWQKAQDLAVKLYQLFRESRDYGFRDQIQRAALSISNNIAEGFERRSSREFRRYLLIAKGSCAEAKSMVHLGRKLGYFDHKQYEQLLKDSEEILKILSGLLKANARHSELGTRN